VRPPQELIDRVEAIFGRRVHEWRRATGGYSIAERWSLKIEYGRWVFAKMAPTDDLAWRLRDEHRKMLLFEEDFRCGVLGWEDGDRPLLVLEDLSYAYWPPPWRPRDIDRLRATLERMWALRGDGLESAEDHYREPFSGWEEVAKAPDGFLSLGLATRDWLEAALPTLIDAARSARLDGRDFLHMDIRSDNLCFAGERVVLVDWNWAIQGHRDLDLAMALPAIRLEGGPLPEEIGRGWGGYAAAFSAFMARNAPLPSPEGAPTVRKFQLRQLRISLPWACRELALPQPDVPYARAEIAQLNRERDAGLITEPEWHNRVEESLIDAYLASDDPRAQSGKSGDETEWRWSRELILDVFPTRATFLDVGCANGYLMESVHRWGAERDIDVEPYGLDISWRIAALARHRLPHWADRIWTGNVIDWDPPMRFDVVQSGLDEAGPARRREVVEKLLRTVVKPGGVLVLRANRVVSGELDRVEQLREVGLEPDGIIEAVHPSTGALRRTAWLRAS
jgi:SAM-dependent methyltransferase